MFIFCYKFNSIPASFLVGFCIIRLDPCKLYFVLSSIREFSLNRSFTLLFSLLFLYFQVALLIKSTKCKKISNLKNKFSTLKITLYIQIYKLLNVCIGCRNYIVKNLLSFFFILCILVILYFNFYF